MNPTEVPGAKLGLSDMFIAKQNHSLVVPESLVVAGEAYVEKRGSKDKKPPLETGRDPSPYRHCDNAVPIAHKYQMTEFIAEQRKALEEIETRKKKQDKEKLSCGVKQTLDKSTLVDIIANKKKQDEIGNAKKSQAQQSSPDLNQSPLEVDHRDQKKQHSWQPPDHSHNSHPHISRQGKSLFMYNT